MSDATAKSKRRPMSNKKFLSIWIPVLAFVALITVVLNVALNVGFNWVASQLGGGTYTVNQSEEAADWDTDYYEADFDTIEDVDTASRELVQDIAGEGIVLAKNSSQSLPLDEGAAVTMLGAAAVNPVYGGAGSGSVDTSTAVTPQQGLEKTPASR